MSNNQELMDIYDDNKQLTGLVLDRKTAFLKKGQYMMYVLAIIINSAGEILITKRALDKKWAAGAWEIPGGGSLAGESSLDAVAREVLEETGLDVKKSFGDEFPKIAPVFSYKNVDLERGDNYFVDIYKFEFDYDKSAVDVSKTECIGVDFATIDAITEIEKTDGFLHYRRLLQALVLEK